MDTECNVPRDCSALSARVLRVVVPGAWGCSIESENDPQMSIHLRPYYHRAICNWLRSGFPNFNLNPATFLRGVKRYSDRTYAMSEVDSPSQRPELSESQSIHKLGEHQICVSKAQNVTEVLTKLEPLLVGQGGAQQQRWHLCLRGKGIRRSFHFKGFKKAWVRRMVALSGVML